MRSLQRKLLTKLRWRSSLAPKQLMQTQNLKFKRTLYLKKKMYGFQASLKICLTIELKRGY